MCHNFFLMLLLWKILHEGILCKIPDIYLNDFLSKEVEWRDILSSIFLVHKIWISDLNWMAVVCSWLLNHSRDSILWSNFLILNIHLLQEFSMNCKRHLLRWVRANQHPVALFRSEEIVWDAKKFWRKLEWYKS